MKEIYFGMLSLQIGVLQHQPAAAQMHVSTEPRQPFKPMQIFR